MGVKKRDGDACSSQFLVGLDFSEWVRSLLFIDMK